MATSGQEIRETNTTMQEAAMDGVVSESDNIYTEARNEQVVVQVGSQNDEREGDLAGGQAVAAETSTGAQQVTESTQGGLNEEANNDMIINNETEGMEVQNHGGTPIFVVGRRCDAEDGQTGRKSMQRKRSKVGEEGQPKIDKFGISKTMHELQELVKKLVKAVTKSSSNAREADGLFTTLAMQVMNMSTELLNYHDEKAALMEQVITLQQNVINGGGNNVGRPQQTAPTYLQTAQKGLAKAVAAGTCLPPPVLPEPVKHVPAEQVILYKAENKGVLPTKAEQEDFRTHLKNIVGMELMKEVSAIRATRYGGYTIIFRSEMGRDEAMRKITQSQGQMMEEGKQQKIIAPKKKVAKVVCREPPVGFTENQVMSEFYGKHNPELTHVRNCNRQAKIFQTRLGWVIEVSTWEAAAIERQGNRIRYGEGREMRVEEFIPLQQCYRCCLFGHSARECSSQHEHCRLCGKQGHSGKDCIVKEERELWRCANCMWNNKNRGTNLPIDHAAAQLHKCAVAQNEKAIRKSQLATAGVFTVSQTPFMPKKNEDAPIAVRSPPVQQRESTTSTSAHNNTGSQSLRRRTPSLHLARCYIPPSTSSTSTTTTTAVRSNVINVRPTIPTGVRVPQLRRGGSRGLTGRGRGYETYDHRRGMNSSDPATQMGGGSSTQGSLAGGRNDLIGGNGVGSNNS